MVRLKAKSLYDILLVARTQQEPSTSGGLPLPIKHRHAPTAKILSLTAQELKIMASDLSAQEGGATALDPTAQEFEGCIVRTGVPLLPVPHPIEAHIPTEMAPMHVNVCDSQWVYCCQAKRCPEGPSP